MKVLHINASYKPAFIYGGPTMSVSMLCEELVRAGTEIMVYTTTANGANELPATINQPINVAGVRVTYFKRLTKDHTHFSPALLIKLWKEAKNYELIHIHAWWNLVSVLSCLVALMRKVPVVVSARGTLSPYSFSNKNAGIKRIIHNFLGKHLLNNCHLHVTSAREKHAMLDLVQPKSIYTIPNLVKLSANKASENHKQSTALKLIFLSRIEEKKGLDILLSALQLITFPYHLTIAGNGGDTYISSLKKFASDNRIADNITWAGFQNENKFDLLREHDLFILPSHDENFGNVVIESLSAGTAVLISQQVGLSAYVTKNSLGWLCETNPVSVSTMINDIGINYRGDIDRIRKQAPQVIYQHFAAGNLVQKYLAMYYQVIDQEQL